MYNVNKILSKVYTRGYVQCINEESLKGDANN